VFSKANVTLVAGAGETEFDADDEILYFLFICFC
jgi:hypothetical protein